MDGNKDYFWPFAVVASVLALMAVVKFTQTGTTPVNPEGT